MVTTVKTIKQKKGFVNPKRAFRGETQTFNNETDGDVIDKRGFGLLGINFPNAGPGQTVRFKVGLTPTPSRFLRNVTIDVSTEEGESISDLAEWPFIQPIFSTAITGDVEFALS